MRLTCSAALASALLLAACADPDYYLLPPPRPAAEVAAPVSSIVVAEMNLPTYVDALEIASQTEGGAVRIDTGALWADNPRRALTRHLVAALQARLDAEVAVDPWPGFDRAEVRIEVAADRLIGAVAGPLEFSGQYAVVEAESGRIVALDRFRIDVPPQGDGYGALLAAHGVAVDRLADIIAARLAGRAGVSSGLAKGPASRPLRSG